MNPWLTSAPRVISVLCLLPLSLTGCLPIAYVYPTVGFIPPRQVGAPPDEVRAFRVDIARSSHPEEPVPVYQSTLGEVPFSPTGRLPFQTKFALGSGHLDRSISPQGPDWSWSGVHPAFEIRLYRPGWKTVRVRAWRWPEQIPWQPAVTPDEQEQALDQLLFACDAPKPPPNPEAKPERPGDDLGGTLFDWDGTSAVLARGSASSPHHDALLFAVAEYERLASLLPESSAAEGQRTRLILKAQRLRTLADE
jgi:hypothetical protein